MDGKGVVQIKTEIAKKTNKSIFQSIFQNVSNNVREWYSILFYTNIQTSLKGLVLIGMFPILFSLSFFACQSPSVQSSICLSLFGHEQKAE